MTNDDDDDDDAFAIATVHLMTMMDEDTMSNVSRCDGGQAQQLLVQSLSAKVVKLQLGRQVGSHHGLGPAGHLWLEQVLVDSGQALLVGLIHGQGFGKVARNEGFQHLQRVHQVLQDPNDGVVLLHVGLGPEQQLLGLKLVAAAIVAAEKGHLTDMRGQQWRIVYGQALFKDTSGLGLEQALLQRHLELLQADDPILQTSLVCFVVHHNLPASDN